MNHILVPTDFSSGSVKSLEYASRISEIIPSDVTLLWIDNYDTNSNLGMDIQAEIRKEKQEELKELLKKLEVAHPSVKFRSKIKQGKVFREVSNYAIAEGTSLVVISTHGGSGFEDYWIGSNAFRIINASPCPVISMKQSFEISKKPITRILVPIDHTPETLHKLPPIIEFGSRFNAEICILSLYTTSLTTIRQKVDHSAGIAAQMVRDAKLTHSVDALETENIVSDLIRHIERTHFDLIAIMTEQNHKEENSLIGPIAQQIINRSPIPVLSIR